MVQAIVIIIYLVVMITIGIFSRRQARGTNGFFVANRRASALFVTGSLVATIIGGSATVGMAGLGFTRGLSGAWWLLVGSIGLLVLGLFLAERVRRFALYTLPDLVEKQYDGRVALAASVLIVIAWLGVIAGQIVATGKILSILSIGSPILWMVLFTVVFVTYTIIGGQSADIRTDLVQALIIFLGIFSALGVVLYQVGGVVGLRSALAPGQFAFPLSAKFSGLDFLGYLFLVGLTYVVGPDMYSRLFCSRDAKTARVSALWAALIIVPFAFGITLVGMGAAALFPKISAEQAFPTIVGTIMPPILGGLVLAALVSATMSSADSCCLSASTILTVNIVKRLKPSLSERQVLILVRWGIAILGLLSLLLALVLKGIINALMFAYTVYTAGVILPVLFGFYRDRLKVTSTGALAAIIGGGAAALVSKLLYIKYLDLGALLISVVLLLVVSFIDNRIKQAKNESS